MTDPQRSHQLTVIELGDAPGPWADAGFTVVDDTVTLGATTIHLTGLGGWFRGWRLDGVADDIDSLVVSEIGPAGDGSHVAHPNGCTGIDHIVVLTGDNDRTIAAFEGADLLIRGHRITETYGFPARQTFFWAGDVIVELIGPETDEMRNDNPVRVFGLALVSEDLAATKSYFGDRMGDVKAAVQPGREIATLRHKEYGISLPVAVMSPHT